MGWREDKDTSKFVPTPKQQAILDVLLDSDKRLLNVSQQIEESGVSRQFWYDTMKHPGFRFFYRTAILDLIQLQAAPMVNSAIKEAVKGNHSHFKTLMEMSNLLTPQEQQVTGDIKVKVSFVSPDSDDDLED